MRKLVNNINSTFKKNIILIICVLLIGCASIPRGDRFWYRKEKNYARKEIIKSAYKVKGKDPDYHEKLKVYDPMKDKKKSYDIDCSGFVRAVFVMAGIDELEDKINNISGNSGVVRIWRLIKSKNKIFGKNLKPKKGDMIFFNNTYDKNGNRKNDDNLTHMGIIESVDRKGTIKYIHSTTSEGVIVSYANPYHPNNVKYNTYLRAEKSKDPKGTRYFSGGLIDSYGTIFDVPK